ncbi:MAG: hypothetical protein ACTSRZ_09490 [Promethearchaeota archaeon]
MQHLWIIDDESGTTVFYRSYSNQKIDPDLVSGLLSALHNLSTIELKQHGIESINMGGLTWVYLEDDAFNLLFIAADTKNVNPQVMKFRLGVIKKAFIDKYNLTPESWKELWKRGDITPFKDFAEIVDLYLEQWEQAEKIMNTAELFDLIGIFQQIFNLYGNIIKSNFFDNDYNEIINSIKNIVNSAKSIDQFKEDKEIQKINYDEEKGWNIIAINPAEVNGDNLLKIFYHLTKKIRELIIKRLGKIGTLAAFSKQLYPFLINNWSLIKKLNLDKKLLSIFLLYP